MLYIRSKRFDENRPRFLKKLCVGVDVCSTTGKNQSVPLIYLYDILVKFIEGVAVMGKPIDKRELKEVRLDDQTWLRMICLG